MNSLYRKEEALLPQLAPSEQGKDGGGGQRGSGRISWGAGWRDMGWDGLEGQAGVGFGVAGA